MWGPGVKWDDFLPKIRILTMKPLITYSLSLFTWLPLPLPTFINVFLAQLRFINMPHHHRLDCQKPSPSYVLDRSVKVQSLFFFAWKAICNLIPGKPSKALNLCLNDSRQFHLQMLVFVFLAVQNSSIGDPVTHSLTHSLRTLLLDRKRATLETCDLWDIWSE